jgi:hypothetical protein
VVVVVVVVAMVVVNSRRVTWESLVLLPRPHCRPKGNTALSIASENDWRLFQVRARQSPAYHSGKTMTVSGGSSPDERLATPMGAAGDG